jgi:ribonuclease Z
VIHSKQGWSFAFSGDTQRSQAFAEAAKHTTLLVHEATFENGLEDEALRKKHSTINDALDVRALVSSCTQALSLFAFSTFHFLPSVQMV